MDEYRAIQLAQNEVELLDMRLHVLLRNLGFGSRRKAEELIGAGRVTVDGKIAGFGLQVQGSEHIEVDGRKIDVPENSGPSELHYLLFNKPVGYTSTNATHFSGEKSVLELLPYTLRNSTQWQIVGRLDKNSEGLLLLTNHGQLCYVMTHPKFEIEKEYEVTLNRGLSISEIAKLLQGVGSVSHVRYRFAAVKEVGDSTYRVILTEGKKREIREAISILGARVVRLVRVRLGELELDGLDIGEFRKITETEKEYLLSLLQRVPNAVAK